MSLDNIQVDKEPTKVVPNEGLVTNSIHMKKESYENARKKVLIMLAEKDKLIANLNSDVTKMVVEGASDEQILGHNIIVAQKIASLENNVNILNVIQGPIQKELGGDRAIRLINKMIKNARANSEMIYVAMSEKQVKSYDDATHENVMPESQEKVISSQEIETTPLVDVEQISKENQEPVKESIENAISAETEAIETENTGDLADLFAVSETEPVQEETIDYNDVESVVDEYTSIDNEDKPFENNENEELIDKQLMDLVNEATIDTIDIPIVEATNESIKPEDEDDFEYSPMTDEEIAESQAKINEKLLRSEEIELSQSMIDEAPLRDEIIVPPTRDELSVENKDEYVPEEATMSMSVSQKDRLDLENLDGLSIDQLQEVIANIEKEKETAAKDYENSKKDVEEIEENYNKIMENKVAVLKEVEDLKAAEEKAAAELKAVMVSKAVSIRNEIRDIQASTHANQDEWNSIKDAGEAVYYEISELKATAEASKEQINKYNDMTMMFTSDEQAVDVSEKGMSR